MADENVVPFSKDAKTFRHASEDPRIEVLHVSSVSKKVASYSFRASTIDHLEDAGGGRSAIVLKSGTTVVLSLAYTKLTETMDEGWSPVDLKQYCDTVVPAAEAQVGDKMADGSVLAGFAPDGKQILAMPADLSVTQTFNDAAKRVEELNAAKALGHDDWIIPTTEQLMVLKQNQNKGALAGTFCTATNNGFVGPDLYWSSTEDRDNSFGVYSLRFSDGYQAWNNKNCLRLSCRPVRVVEAPRP